MSIKVIDLSRWEDNPADPRRVDFAKMKQAGVSAAYFRCGNGLQKDTVFDQFRTDATKAGMPWGAYGIMYPTITIKNQAQVFVKALSPNPGELPIAIDWELEGVTWKMIAEYIAIVQAAFPYKEIIIYSRAEYLRRCLPSMFFSLAKYSWFAKFAVWQAQYASKPDALPIMFQRVLWQYTDRADAATYGVSEAKMVDMSIFDGTLDQFNARFGLNIVPPDDDPPVDPKNDDFPHLYRILNDVEAGIESEGGPRPYIRNGPVGPPTVKLEGGSAMYRIPSKWIDYLEKINTKKAMNYLFKPASGWQNSSEPYVVRTLTFAGNVVEVLRIEGKRAYIKTISLDDDPPTALIKPTEKQPHSLVHMFTIQYILTGGRDNPNSAVRLDYTTDGRNASILLLSPVGEKLWIDVRNLARL